MLYFYSNFFRLFIGCSILGLFLYPSITGLAQTQAAAEKFLSSVRKPTLDVSSSFLEYNKMVLLEGYTRRAIRDKKSLLNDVQSGRKAIEETTLFNGQEYIQNAYLNYFTAMGLCLNQLPTTEFESVEYFDQDSASKFLTIQLQQLELVLKESDNLKTQLEKFCFMNKVIGKKTTGSLFTRQSEAIKVIEYAVKIKNAVMVVRRTNRQFFVSLREDTGSKSELVRQELLESSAQAKFNLAAIPTFRADYKLKRAAMKNVRLYGLAAAREYKKLVAFRIKELAFIQLSSEYKEKRHNPEFDQTAYFEEVKQFSKQIKENKKEVKTLDKNRLQMEKSFDETFSSFVKNRFLLEGQTYVRSKWH